jgi:hypothetical protein
MRWIAIALTASATGCASLQTRVVHKWKSMERRPNKVVVSAAPNHIERDGFPYHQGILVRCHFFLNEEPITMMAEGEMTFTAYDKSKVGDNPAPQPVGVYVIKPEELDKHRSRDIVGVSYAFWLPYEPDCPTQMVVNATFRPTYGEPFTAEPSTVSLSPLKQSLTELNTAEKRRPRPNYVAFDSIGPKSAAPKPATIDMTRKPGLPVQQTGGMIPQNSVGNR